MEEPYKNPRKREAVKRAIESVSRKRRMGLKERRLWITPESSERIDRLIEKRGLRGLSALVEMLVEEAR